MLKNRLDHRSDQVLMAEQEKLLGPVTIFSKVVPCLYGVRNSKLFDCYGCIPSSHKYSLQFV